MQPSSGGLARYELHEVLGGGGAGVTYRAYDTLLRREVALKIILDASGEASFRLLRRAWDLQKAIAHNNVGEIYDVGEMEHGGARRPYCSMPLLAGDPLSDLIHASGPRLSVERGIGVILQTCRGLQAAHDRGLIHGDLKPSNILVLRDESVQIIDFGITRALNLARMSVRGTLAYMAPELVQMKPASVASDLFALGVLSYQALTGRLPFEGATEADFSRAILHDDPVPVSELTPTVPAGVSQAILKVLAKRPWDRFPSAGDYGDAIEHALRQVPVAPLGSDERRNLPSDLGDPGRHLLLLKEDDARLEPEQRAGQAAPGAGAAPGNGTSRSVPPGEAPQAAPPEPPAPLPRRERPRQEEASGRHTVPAGGPARAESVARYALIGAALVILLGSGWGLWKQLLPPAPPPVQVEIRTNPRGARISVNDQPLGESAATLRLAPGDYQAAAEMEGFQPAVTSFKILPGEPVSLELVLQSWKTVVRLSSEADLTQAALAGKPLHPGAAGEYVIEGLDDGTYPLTIVSPKGEAEATLAIENRGLPVLGGPPQARNLTLLLVHAAGERLAVYTSSATSLAGLDGQPAQPVPADGLSFQAVGAGRHQITLEDKGAPRTVVFQTGGPPAVNVFVLVPSEPDKGSILVVAGEDGASVMVNSHTQRVRTRGGQLNVGGLKPGTYRIRVAKDGFESPPPQDVEVREGQQTRLEVRLKPVVRMAAVRIQGPAGAQILMDGQPVGVIAPDGGYAQDVSPGSHTFELRRGGAQSRQSSHEFRAGETVRIGEELALRPENGFIRFEVSPADATVAIRRQGEPEAAARSLSQNPASVPEGVYVVTASAPRHITGVMSVIVQGGTTATASMALRQVETARAAPAAEPIGIEDFDNPGAWTQDGDWRVRRGGKFVTFKPPNAGGTFSFQIQLRKGKRLQWFLALTDSRNYVLFRLDRQSFTRSLVAGGKTTEMGRSANPVPGVSAWEVRISVEPDRIVHEIRQGGNWITLDTCREMGRDLTAGKFGFFIPETMIPGHDEYAVRGFRFVPRGK